MYWFTGPSDHDGPMWVVPNAFNSPAIFTTLTGNRCRPYRYAAKVYDRVTLCTSRDGVRSTGVEQRIWTGCTNDHCNQACIHAPSEDFTMSIIKILLCQSAYGSGRYFRFTNLPRSKIIFEYSSLFVVKYGAKHEGVAIN